MFSDCSSVRPSVCAYRKFVNMAFYKPYGVLSANLQFLLRPGRGVEYCDQPVCLYVCLSVRKHTCISGTAGAIFTKFCTQIPYGRGSIFLWRRWDMLCRAYFRFMDDVTFGRNRPYGDSGVAISGRSLMSMNALWCTWNKCESVRF